jgi:hypothetical protein
MSEIIMDEPVNIENTLALISTTPVASDEEHMAVLKLIAKVQEQIGPTATLMLQVEASLKLYNATKNPQDPTRSIADAILLMQGNRGTNFGD